LAEFYERAGRVTTLDGDRGSVSLIGAVSPPGGDFSEPVTQHTRRFVRCFWALDKDLAAERHFPAVNWLRSYSQYVDDVSAWWTDQGWGSWAELREQALEILQREDHLRQIVQLIGADALPDDERLTLETARLLREGFLQQSAMDDIDTYSSIEKQFRMLQLILDFNARAGQLLDKGCPIVIIRDLEVVNEILRAKQRIGNDNLDELDQISEHLQEQMDKLKETYG
jgi:V/A-type H+-transporting ATPase subunit A